MNLDDEDRYCSRQLVTQLLEAKDIFDTIGNDTLRQARIRANPYEALQSGFFLNRSEKITFFCMLESAHF
jgi:cap1 methyltransferase